jgi:hypothetical protein
MGGNYDVYNVLGVGDLCAVLVAAKRGGMLVFVA